MKRRSTINCLKQLLASQKRKVYKFKPSMKSYGKHGNSNKKNQSMRNFKFKVFNHVNTTFKCSVTKSDVFSVK